MATTVEVPSDLHVPTRTGKVIDVDIHHEWAYPETLFDYMSEGWREYVQGPSKMGLGSTLQGKIVPISPPSTWSSPVGVYRPEAYGPDGSAPASDYETLRVQHLDPNRIERCILSFGAGSFVGALPNPYLALEVARAGNNWCIDTWLNGLDDRLYSTLLVATQLPSEAAKEIRRAGGHPRIAEARLVSSGLGKPFGHPVYHPIYEACAEMDLPIAIHFGGDGPAGQVVAPTASGPPSSYLELFVLLPQGIMSHVTSLILHGVFEKYRNLKVLLAESGAAWIPWLLWRLDAEYKALRRDAPWLKRWPSEYFYEHFRVATQPLEAPHKQEQLIDLLSMVNGEDILCYSSDYPHWDADELPHVMKVLPRKWQSKVLRENAMDFYGWKDTDAKSQPGLQSVPVPS